MFTAKRHFLLGMLTLSFCAFSFAGQQQYDSGLLRHFSDELTQPGREEAEAFSRFIDEHFSRFRPDFEWRESRTFRDRTHTHRTYDLFYRGRRVFGQSMKLHYNRKGWLEYAASSWETPFSLALPTRTEATRRYLVAELKSKSMNRDGYFRGQVRAEPVIWADRNGDATAAFEVKYHEGLAAAGAKGRHYVVDEITGAVLGEWPVMRNVSVANSKAWKVSPFNADNTLAPDTVTLTDLDEATRLKNGFFHVRRLQNLTAPALREVNPDPATDPTALPFSTKPADYDHDCTGDEVQCPNQRMDSINVYYHLNGYRQHVQTLVDTLEITPSPTAATDPLAVIVNAFAIDTDGNGTKDEANNAGYFPFGCGSTSDGTVIDRCLIFLKPAPVTSALCGSGAQAFYDLAREAMVVVHEYQHYVTDTIIALDPGTTAGANVGDALHEGYSDYFAASEISHVAGRDVTLIGEYGFQNCTFLQREIGNVRVYENSEAETDSHVAGLSWASGLWQLREELGRTTADLLALKSIFFLSQKVGFVESIEALVKADKALNDGVNVDRIRELFYDEIRWTGGKTDIFRDRSTGIAEVGFRSCNSVPMLTLALSAPGTGLGFLGWLGLTLLLGRRARRPGRPRVGQGEE